MRICSLAVAMMLIAPIPAAIAAAPARPPVADPMQECAKIADPKARLECFDAQARTLPQAPLLGPVAVAGAGKWEKGVDTNPLDDTRTVTLVLAADVGRSRWSGPVRLILRCQSGQTEVYISWGDYLGSDAAVTWRTGSAPPKTDDWGISTSNDSTFYPGDAVAFIRQLTAADKLVAQVTPYNESPLTAEFDIRGLGLVVGDLQTACGWK